MNYVVYHLHDETSLLDSCTNYKLYVDKAIELGQKAIAFTNHGRCYNWVEKKIYCDSKGIKYIHGVEIYLTQTLEKNIRDNYHTVLLAKNEKGIKEINKLIHLSSQKDHTYYKPRISFDEFLNISNDVIKISACLASPLHNCKSSVKYNSLCKAYDFYEIQPHVNSQDQKDYNLYLLDLSKKYNKPLIVGTDTHSLNSYKAECRTILQVSKRISFSNEDEFDLTYKSFGEVIDMFNKQGVLDEDIVLDALNNTNVMADMVETTVLDTSFKYPKLKGNEEVLLKALINKKYNEKIKQGIIKKDKAYSTKIKEEFKVLKKIGMLGFMLFMSNLLTWCRENGIPYGFCRGSVGGSEIAYLTDIIDLDPVVWNTIFSRFANEDRIEIGDIDVDISPSQRELVVNHIIEEFGEDNTAYVLSMGTITDKATIDEIGRALNTLWEKENPNKDKFQSPYTLNNIKIIKQEFESNPETTRKKYPKLFYYFNGLLGTTVSQSRHPAGIICSPVTLPDNYGAFWNEGKQILLLNMEEVHEVSLVKYDILGLKNIEIIKDTCGLSNIKYPLSHEINWNDEKVWEDITTSPVGIFQFESDFAFELLKRYKPTKINDLSLINAALRPAGISYRDRLLAREVNKNPSEIIDELLKDNLGYLVFQEDTIKFLQSICGLSGSEADNVRRAIGRKQLDRLQKALPNILEGYCKKSNKPREIAEQEAKAFLQIIEDSSDYQFGYNHSTGYSMIGYTCAYYRYYKPLEFVTAYLNNAKDDKDIQDGTSLAAQKGIIINSIKFRYSRANYFPYKETNSIYKGISSIKYMSKDVSDKLYNLKDNRFNSFIDFLKVNPCDSRQSKILIKLDFFSEFGEDGKLLKAYELFNKLYGKSQFKKDNLPINEDIIKKYSIETPKVYKVTDCDKILVEVYDALENKGLPLKIKLETQQEYLGYIDYKNPNLKGFIYVTDLDTKYSPKIISTDLSTGENITYKINVKNYSSNPFNKNDILQIISSEQRNKSRMVDGKWQKLLEEFEVWITKYKVRG